MAGLRGVWDQALQLPESGFSRYGYRFDRWNTQPAGDGKGYEAGEEAKNLAGGNTDGDRVTLYAQ